MSLSYNVLGRAGWDNGLYVRVNGGTKVYRLLFDCGENILKDLNQHDVRTIDYLVLSHLHIDHIAGFDYFFRRNYDREKKAVFIFGPADTIDIIHSRMRGFKWNLVEGVPGEWYVNEFTEKRLTSCLFKTTDGFSKKHKVKKKSFDGLIINNTDFSVTVTLLDHIIPSAAYFVKEKPSLNINKDTLTKTGWKPGSWLEKVRDLKVNPMEKIELDGKAYTLKHLRDMLLEKNEGESIGYLTDFIYNKLSAAKIKRVFQGCDTMVCESQYHPSEQKFAKKNFHLTSTQAAKLAKAANVKKLILFHISDRYRTRNFPALIEEARKIFPETYLPNEWKIKN
jgi:ribonuclease Z